MQNNPSKLQNFINSPEFKRKSSHATEDTLKFSFKWMGIAVKGTANFIKTIIMSILGK